MITGHLIIAGLTLVFIIILIIMFRIIGRGDSTIELLRREKKSIMSQEKLATEKLGDLEEKEELKGMVNKVKSNTLEVQTLKSLI